MGESVGPSSFVGNPHADVLGCNPTEEGEKERLLVELRTRAKGAFRSKDMRSCDLLYTKALELCSTDHLLHSNRAMVYLNLGKLHEALKDCEDALKIDKTFVKAHYRKAQALQRLGKWDEARAAIAVGKDVKADPLFDACLAEVEKAATQDEELKAQLRKDAQDSSKAETPQQAVSLASMVDRKNKKAEAAAKEASGEESAAKSEGNSLRGYKKTADGKTTSFFHMDIDEEAKKLLEAQGKAPKKLEGPVQDEQDSMGRSAWNKAGTWESKNLMKWAKEQLEQWAGAKISLPVGDGVIEIEEVCSLDGNCEIVCARGKRRRVMDLGFDVKWKLQLGGGSSKASGKITFVDVGPDDDHELTVSFDKSSSPDTMPVADSFVKSASQGLQPELQAKLKKFMASFNEL